MSGQESKEPTCSFKCIFLETKEIYHIKGVFDLDNDTIQLPKAAKIVFENGARVENGVIYGEDNIIQSKSKNPIFKNISFIGNFIGKPSANWFSISYNRQVDNSFELNSALNLTHISSIKELKLPYSKLLYVRSNVIDAKTKTFLKEGTVEIKSDVCFDLNSSTIKCLPNSAQQYNILYSRESRNIIIKNGIICGDVGNHFGNDGEWGYGIELQGVHGFLLENLECKNCWGDGINIQVSTVGDGNSNSEITRKGHCLNGIIRNVYCHHNRRQGMSVEGVIGLEIINSSFCSTGGTRPQSGLDLEPYSPYNIVTNVLIKKCSFNSNEYSGLLIMSTEKNVRDVLIDSCNFTTNKAYDIIMTGKNITVKHCPYNKTSFSLKLVGDCDGINIVKSNVSKISAQDFSKGHHVRDIVFSECKVSIKKGLKAAFEDDLTLTDCDMSFNNCEFDFSNDVYSKGLFLFNGKSSNYYSYNDCVFYLGKNTLNAVATQSFNKCIFIAEKKNKDKVRKCLDGNTSVFNNCIIK